MNENLKNNAAQIIKGLAIIFLLVLVVTGLYLLACANGSVSTSDDSTLGNFVFFLTHRPFIIGFMVAIMAWGYVISLREEKREKETGLKRPATKMENKFYNFWDKALSDKK